MEDPVRFDVWGRIIPAQREAALATIRSQKLYPSEVELRKGVNNAARTGGLIRVAKSLPYLSALNFMSQSKHFLCDQALSQEDWVPKDGTTYCEMHHFHFGGCLGCHVCRGVYVE